MTTNKSNIIVSYITFNNATTSKVDKEVELLDSGITSPTFVVLFSICVTGLGTLANSIVMAKIFCDKTLHRPSQVAICFLILSYTLALLTSFWHFNFMYVISVASKMKSVGFISLALLINKETFVHAAALHTACMSILKFKISTNPLRQLSTYVIVKSSLWLWIFSTLYGVIAFGILLFLLKSKKFSEDSMDWLYIGTRLYLLFIPLGIMLTFHCLKLRRSRLPVLSEEQSHGDQEHAIRTSNLICIVLIIYILTNTPYLVVYLAQSVERLVQKPKLEQVHVQAYTIRGQHEMKPMDYVTPFCKLLWLINYSSVGFVYYIVFVCKCRFCVCCNNHAQRDMHSDVVSPRDFNPESVMQESVV